MVVWLEVEWEHLLKILRHGESLLQPLVKKFATTEIAIALEAMTNPSRPGSPGIVERETNCLYLKNIIFGASALRLKSHKPKAKHFEDTFFSEGQPSCKLGRTALRKYY